MDSNRDNDTVSNVCGHIDKSGTRMETLGVEHEDKNACSLSCGLDVREITPVFLVAEHSAEDENFSTVNNHIEEVVSDEPNSATAKVNCGLQGEVSSVEQNLPQKLGLSPEQENVLVDLCKETSEVKDEVGIIAEDENIGKDAETDEGHTTTSLSDHLLTEQSLADQDDPFDHRILLVGNLQSGASDLDQEHPETVNGHDQPAGVDVESDPGHSRSYKMNMVLEEPFELQSYNGSQTDDMSQDRVAEIKPNMIIADSLDTRTTLHSSSLEEHVHLCMDEPKDEQENVPQEDLYLTQIKGEKGFVEDEERLNNGELQADMEGWSGHPPPVINSDLVQMKSTCSQFSDIVGMLKSSVSTLQQHCDQSTGVFDSLPAELVIKIFSYLTVQEICRSVSPVCRQWRLLSHDPSLWKSISFYHSPNLSSLNLLWILRKAPHLRKLVLSGRTNITLVEVDILSGCCSMLQDVNLGFCDSLNCDMIKILVSNCPQLRSLNVEGCGLIDSNCVRYIAKCPKISELNFSHCQLVDEDLKHLAQHVAEIRSLNIDGISWITDQGVISVVSRHKDHLVSLYVDGAELSDISLRHISNCVGLKHLAISFCETLTDETLQYLPALTSLKSLKLRKGSYFTTEGLMSVFKPENFPSLQCLDLSECVYINDVVTLQIVQCCGRNLKLLALCWCWNITDTGLVSIVDHCSNLENLNLLGIDKITGVCLSRVPEEIPNLTFLDLQQCNKIVDSLIVEMVRQKTDLKVINYYGEEFVY